MRWHPANSDISTVLVCGTLGEEAEDDDEAEAEEEEEAAASSAVADSPPLPRPRLPPLRETTYSSGTRCVAWRTAEQTRRSVTA
jgi:hypothetical protein